MRLHLSLAPATPQLRVVRRVLEAWAGAHDLAPESLLLIATELLANAMAVCPADAQVELVAELHGEEVSLAVTDCGASAFEPGELLPPTVHSVRGRGLHIVQSLSNRLTIERVEDRTVITAYQYRRMLDVLHEGRNAGQAGSEHPSR
jgi:anti-sigma regulatory factor (Ser/Thr protein kinase)